MKLEMIQNKPGCLVTGSPAFVGGWFALLLRRSGGNPIGDDFQLGW